MELLGAVALVLGVFVGIPLLYSHFFSGYISPAERKRIEEFKKLRETDPNARMPPEASTPQWVTIILGILFFLFFILPILALPFSNDPRAWVALICIGFIVIPILRSRR